ncbi:MAG TPA: ATP-binding protein [Clostridia bacterium]|nr:ATP-binding protein [Clostridia bacterium]
MEIPKEWLEAAQRNSIFQSEYKCKKCNDTGYISVISEGSSCAQECKCQAIRRMERAIAKSGIADAFKACKFENFIPWDPRVVRAKEIAQKYAKDFLSIENERMNSLALLGAVGCGKTMLGICVLNTLVQDGVDVLYTPYREMVSSLKRSVLDEYEYTNVCRRFINPRILFIDDLYKGRTENDPKYVYDIVNARYLAKSPMIITSELQADGLMQIDEAVASRIIEMSRSYIRELCGDGLNYRLRGL